MERSIKDILGIFKEASDKYIKLSGQGFKALKSIVDFYKSTLLPININISALNLKSNLITFNFCGISFFVRTRHTIHYGYLQLGILEIIDDEMKYNVISEYRFDPAGNFNNSSVKESHLLISNEIIEIIKKIADKKEIEFKTEPEGLYDLGSNKNEQTDDLTSKDKAKLAANMKSRSKR